MTKIHIKKETQKKKGKTANHAKFAVLQSMGKHPIALNNTDLPPVNSFYFVNS